jgi:hypothetical protein
MVILGHRRKHHSMTWTPLALGPALLAWAEGHSFAAVDGTPIDSWPDLSGNGRNWTQGNVTLQPTQQTHGGVRVARFDATNDGMLGSVNLTTNNFTLVAAYRVASTASVFRRAVQGNTRNWLMGPYGGTYRIFDGRNFLPFGPSLTTGFVIHSVSQFAASTPDATHWVNGTVAGSINHPGTPESLSPIFGHKILAEVEYVSFS